MEKNAGKIGKNMIFFLLQILGIFITWGRKKWDWICSPPTNQIFDYAPGPWSLQALLHTVHNTRTYVQKVDDSAIE